MKRAGRALKLYCDIRSVLDSPSLRELEEQKIQEKSNKKSVEEHACVGHRARAANIASIKLISTRQWGAHSG